MIAGIVSDPAGNGLAHIVVDAGAHEPAVGQTDENGAFRIAQLLPGDPELRLRIPGPPETDGHRWPASTGQRDVHLAVEVGADLRVRIPDWTPARDRRRIRIAPVRASPELVVPPREIEILDATFTLYGLDEFESYSLHEPAGSPGRIGWAPRVSPQGQSVVLPLTSAVVLEGKIDLPRDLHTRRVHVEAYADGMLFPGRVQMRAGSGLSWRVEGLPVSELEIVGWAGKRAAPEAKGTVHAAPGRSAELHLLKSR